MGKLPKNLQDRILEITVAAKQEKSLLPVYTCLCGCGGTPSLGRHYCSGHDARLRGQLQRAHVAQQRVAYTVGGQRTEHSAWEVAERLGDSFTTALESAERRRAAEQHTIPESAQTPPENVEDRKKGAKRSPTRPKAQRPARKARA